MDYLFSRSWKWQSVNIQDMSSECYPTEAVLDTYYPKERTILAPLRVTYIFAGPREAVLHALIMKNYGCTHALIGRDHAGIGDYYDKYASHTIFDKNSNRKN